MNNLYQLIKFILKVFTPLKIIYSFIDTFDDTNDNIKAVSGAKTDSDHEYTIENLKVMIDDHSYDSLMPIFLYKLLTKNQKFDETQKLIMKEIAEKFTLEAFNIICVIANNSDMLQPYKRFASSATRSCDIPRSYGINFIKNTNVNVPYEIMYFVFLYQRKEMVGPLINLGWEFNITYCLRVLDTDTNTLDEKIEIVRDFFVDALSPIYSCKINNNVPNIIENFETTQHRIINEHWEIALKNQSKFPRSDYIMFCKISKTINQKVHQWIYDCDFQRPNIKI